MAGIDYSDFRSDFPIVNPDGTPTKYFLETMFGNVAAGKTTEESVESVESALATKVEETRQILSGLGLSGGGDLSTDRTLALDADIDDLNDVDTTTTAPTDGQALVYQASSGLWLPGSVASGGGGGGGGGWTLAEKITVSSPVSAVTFTDLDFENCIVVMEEATFSTANNYGLLHVSVDNGSSFYTTSGDYKVISRSSNGATNTIGAAFSTSVTSTSPKSGSMLIFGNGLLDWPIIDEMIDRDRRRFAASTSPIDAIRITAGNGGNITGGDFYVLVNKAGAGGGGGGASWTKHTVATAGDSFIDIPITKNNFELIVKGKFTTGNDQLYARVSDDGGSTFYSGSSDYKHSTSNSSSAILITGSVGDGRECNSKQQWTGFNGTTRRFVMTGTSTYVDSGGSLGDITVAGYPNTLGELDYDAIRVLAISSNQMDDFEILLNEWDDPA